MKDLDHKKTIGIYIVAHKHKKSWINKAVFSISKAKKFIHKSFDTKLWLIDTSNDLTSQKITEGIALEYKIPYLNYAGFPLNKVANKALNFIDTDYIVRLDADDWVDKSYLNEISIAILNNPNVDAFIPAYTEVNENEEVLRKIIRNDLIESEVLDNPCHGACTVFKRNFIKIHGGYSETIDRQDGYYIWLRLIKHGSFKVIPTSEFFYRQHGANLTSSVSTLWEARYQILIDWMWDSLKDNYVIVIPTAKLGTIFEEVYSYPIKDKPYLFWYLEKFKKFKNIIIYGDTKYMDIAKHYGYTFVPRVSISNDQWLDIRSDASDIIGTKFKLASFIAVCNVEYPFLKESLIKAAISSTSAFSVDACITGEDIDRDIYCSSNHGLEKINDANTQSSKRFYRRSGCIEVRKIDSFKKDINHNISFLPLDSLSSLRITNVDQLQELGAALK